MENNIKMNLQETAWGWGLDWIDLAESRDRRRALGNIVINLGVKSGEFD